jgi:hypothetical protein
VLRRIPRQGQPSHRRPSIAKPRRWRVRVHISAATSIRDSRRNRRPSRRRFCRAGVRRSSRDDCMKKIFGAASGVLLGIRMQMMMPVLRRPPKDAFLRRRLRQHSEHELEHSACCIRAMREVTMITGADCKHAQPIEQRANCDALPRDPGPYCCKACNVDRTNGTAAGYMMSPVSSLVARMEGILVVHGVEAFSVVDLAQRTLRSKKELVRIDQVLVDSCNTICTPRSKHRGARNSARHKGVSS